MPKQKIRQISETQKKRYKYFLGPFLKRRMPLLRYHIRQVRQVWVEVQNLIRLLSVVPDDLVSLVMEYYRVEQISRIPLTLPYGEVDAYLEGTSMIGNDTETIHNIMKELKSNDMVCIDINGVAHTVSIDSERMITVSPSGTRIHVDHLSKYWLLRVLAILATSVS